MDDGGRDARPGHPSPRRGAARSLPSPGRRGVEVGRLPPALLLLLLALLLFRLLAAAQHTHGSGEASRSRAGAHALGREGSEEWERQLYGAGRQWEHPGSRTAGQGTAQAVEQQELAFRDSWGVIVETRRTRSDWRIEVDLLQMMLETTCRYCDAQ
ncbi:hypothetical protein BDY21DRAFT_365678 [Lineolata rhizophorae]|uniref:Uncharacterized protein n=1 Tax=Lineolata rhizophorae TaxID=578093 RepID=A0A6A6NUD2_9PEZI|nr:hypothetical protein BDY21DRAFT_365678 [Lineolata rhizophorae]